LYLKNLITKLFSFGFGQIIYYITVTVYVQLIKTRKFLINYAATYFTFNLIFQKIHGIHIHTQIGIIPLGARKFKVYLL